MDLSIIIVNFNTPQLTLDCIQSVTDHTSGISYEIILVDNAPKEDNRQTFEKAFPTLLYLRSDHNIGFGRANNLGMEVAKGAYLLLLNSDTIILDNSLQRCITFMKQHPDAGMLGCKLLNEDGSYQPSYYPYSHPSIWNYMAANNPLLYKISGVAKRYRETDVVAEVGDISGAFMLLPRSLFAAVKGFDPDFFLYCEETEWCRNRIAENHKIYYFPQAQIIHLGGKSAPKEAMRVQSQISLGLYWYKTGWFSYTMYIVFSFFNCLYYLCTYPLAGAGSKKSIRDYISAFRLSWPYLLRDIPRYARAYNSRREPLIYKGAREIFFGTENNYSEKRTVTE